MRTSSRPWWILGALALLGAFGTTIACLGWGVPYEENTVGCVQNEDCRSGFACVDGLCASVCGKDADCTDEGAICVRDTCRVPVPGYCRDEFDCIFPTACESTEGAACNEGRCAYPVAPSGTGCDDEDPCTTDEVCDEAGTCLGIAVECTMPPANHCNPTNDELITYPGIGGCDPTDGSCDYPPTTTPCANCGTACLAQCEGVVCPNEEGGCQILGTCIGGIPAECVHTSADDDTRCDLDGEPVGSLAGVCSSGRCVGCNEASQCTRPPAGELQCYDIVCDAGTCQYTVRAGGACDDGELCTHTDVCDSSGACAGTPITCNDDPGSCGIQRSCNGTAQCTETQATTGSSCDDGNPCTYNDVCNGGTCAGTAISCTNDAAPCGAQRSCNGTSSCAVTYPSGNACDDGNLCTHTDRCNGAGACAGTAISCTDDSGVCAANRSCNGTAICTVTYPGTGTSCNDGNACTQGDHCNGAGACVKGSNKANGTSCGGSTWVVCCTGECTDLRTNKHCGACRVDCTSGTYAMTCRATASGGYTCGTCAGTSSYCKQIYSDSATCWPTNWNPPGNNLCQCQCGTDNTVCSGHGCGTGMYCYDCGGDNYCSPVSRASCP